jgi:hypothetical protein
MQPMDEKEFVAKQEPFYKPDLNFAFSLFSLDEFIKDVCVAGKHNLYWPRTQKYYTVPKWYQDKLPQSLAAFRSVKN